MSAEIITLDPAAITGGTRVEVQISGDGGGPIEVRQDGVDWGDAEIIAVMADLGGVGSVPVDFDIPNRIIEMKVKIQPSSSTTFAQARSMLQAKVAQIQAEGGWISREMPGVGTVYADLVNAKLALPGDWMQAHRDIQVEATLSFEAIPDFYEAEWEELEASDVVAGEGQWRGVFSDVRGDFPKGNRCKIVVEGDPDHDQLGVKYGIRSRHYSADPRAALSYPAEALLPLDMATVEEGEVTGAGDDTVVKHGNIGTDWTPVLGLSTEDDNALTHVGTYRVEVRVQTTAATPPELRCIWDIGDMLAPVENAPVPIPNRSSFYSLDLGEIRLDRAPIGNHQWGGQIQARGADGGETVYIDRVRFWPVAEHYARVTAPLAAASARTAFAWRDNFKQSSGDLTGKTAAVGGTYLALAGSDTTDFTINTADDTARRTAVSDSDGPGILAGRAVGANINLTATGAKLEYAFSDNVTVLCGLLVRVVDANNYLAVIVMPSGSPELSTVLVHRVVGGSGTLLKQVNIPSPAHVGTLETLVIRDQYVVLHNGREVAAGSDAFLGSTLVGGDVYLYDGHVGSTPVTRDYRYVAAWPVAKDAVIFSGDGELQLRSDGAYRLRGGGGGVAGGYGSVTPWGDYPRLPQGGPVEVMVATSRGDYDQLPDSGLDDVAVGVHHRACWLTAPGLFTP
jgi:hypothetical protein